MDKSSTTCPGAPDPTVTTQMARHEDLVCWVVRQQWRGPLSFADALHAGRIGLWHALCGYDPTRGTRFSSYAVPAIARSVWAAVSAAGESLPLQSVSADLVADSDLAEVCHQTQVACALHALVATLPPRLRDLIGWRYGLDGTPPQTFHQFGARWGISRQRVHQLHRQALLLLAHPARSQALRLLTDHAERAAYQQTLARHHQYARAQRRSRR